MQLETGNNVNNYQLSIRLILREPGVYSQLNRLPHLQGGVVKCNTNKKSAGLSS